MTVALPLLLLGLLTTKAVAKIFDQPHPSCAISKYTTNDFTNLTVFTNDDPRVPLEAPAISGMNGTNWDYWYFDGTDVQNPKAGIVVAFWRSAPAGDISQSPLRVDVYATDLHGTPVKSEFYVEESYIVNCFDQTYGVWNNTDGQTVTFEIDAALTEATITFDTRQLQGTYTIVSDSKPRILNNEPLGSADSEFRMSPGVCHNQNIISNQKIANKTKFYWTEPIPLGNVTVNIDVVGGPVPKLQVEGKGGHDRNWGTRLIPELAQDWHFLRLWIGPFQLIYYQVTTGLWSETNVTYTSAILFEDEKTIFTSHTVPGQIVSSTEDYTTFNFTWGGTLEATNYNPSTGYVIDFFSPSRNMSWQFESNHTAMLYQLPPNPYEETAYRTNVGRGGLEGRETYDGIGITQECQHLGKIPGQLL